MSKVRYSVVDGANSSYMDHAAYNYVRMHAYITLVCFIKVNVLLEYITHVSQPVYLLT